MCAIAYMQDIEVSYLCTIHRCKNIYVWCVLLTDVKYGGIMCAVYNYASYGEVVWTIYRCKVWWCDARCLQVKCMTMWRALFPGERYDGVVCAVYRHKIHGGVVSWVMLTNSRFGGVVGTVWRCKIDGAIVNLVMLTSARFYVGCALLQMCERDTWHCTHEKLPLLVNIRKYQSLSRPALSSLDGWLSDCKCHLYRRGKKNNNKN